ncbi:MAG: c-type cytochrome [Planctomycetes bacterium]|nr:c-type cytochrome [Planctomycetota bacterium]
MYRTAYLLLALLVFATPQAAKEKPKWPPSPHVAATEPLRPAEQKKTIKLPPGFELQLVAADPDIRKPININFDAAGRLWVTETIEYPFAAADAKGRDAVKILEDFGPDGKARKITTFADGLNIPIGVIPTAKGALVYSIPSIYHMTDTKGTGKADKREVFYSQFGTQDTHGMTGEFQQGFDGWIYACHGFSNTSNVKCQDGTSSIKMTSGNTYRIKADGSRIEQHTWGQVNPFGLAFDPLGNLYSGDCHSRPLTMLLRHGTYESFARPHDGLGFAPHMNTFDGHSTALCGVAYYAADQYPEEYRGMLFLGDVVLNRINAYELKWDGASPKAVMKPFLTSSDPWFRPVDIKLGPDGCLYFADFYNRIIGHYEVALNHPGRDRDKGRIWRIVYRGNGADSDGPRPVVNLAKADVLHLVAALGSPNLTVRLQATHQLVERGGAAAVASLQPIVKNVEKEGDGARKVHALWALERLGKLDDETLARAVSASEREVRVHAQRILTEKQNWTPKYAAMAKLGIDDKEAAVQRVAVEALAAHPAADQVEAVAGLRNKVTAKDTHLYYAARLALREQLRSADAWKGLRVADWSNATKHAVADVCLGIRNEPSAEFLKSYMLAFGESVTSAQPYTHYIVRYGNNDSIRWALDDYLAKNAKNLGLHGGVLKAAAQAAQERGIAFTQAERASAEVIVHRLLDQGNPGDKQTGAELAGMLKMSAVQPKLLTLIASQKMPDGVRKASIAAMLSIDAKKAVEPLVQIVLSEKEGITIREQVARDLGGSNHPEALAGLAKALETAPARLEYAIATGLTSSKQGGEKLLQTIEAGKASARVLQTRAILLRLEFAKVDNYSQRIANLTRGLPSLDQKTQELIAKRRDGFASFASDAEAGKKIFQKHCANCHQIAGQGAKIGPNLDGIGARGLERLLEDVLDPNRNVDQAFRTTVITTKDGKTVTGLFLREEGKIVILADNLGKEVRIDKAMIDDRALSPLSPMPANVAEIMTEPEFHHLMAYLLGQRGKP